MLDSFSGPQTCLGPFAAIVVGVAPLFGKRLARVEITGIVVVAIGVAVASVLHA